jgi:uncharacterized protein (DUF1697 family)
MPRLRPEPLKEPSPAARLDAMFTHIALLRGINVGGRARLPMAELRGIATGLGFTDVATYIQSGNLILSAPATGEEVAERLHEAIATATGLEVAVTTRTRYEWGHMIAANPFPVGTDDGKKLHVIFMARPPGDAYASVDPESYAPERYAVVGREVYLWLPNGIGRSKLAAAISRSGEPGTARNWNTVLRVAELAG